MKVPGPSGHALLAGLHPSKRAVGQTAGLAVVEALADDLGRLAVALAQYSRLRALSSPTQAVNVHEQATSGVPAAMQDL